MSYASRAVQSLLRNCMDSIRVRLITDAAEDKRKLQDMVDTLDHHGHEVHVHAQTEADEIAEERFAKWPVLRRFRMGHPCWRKITDPPLFVEPGQEVIILDPDVYFPNRFRFDEAPERGVRIMWQRPNCLLPPHSVAAAFRAPARLADHMDIGSAHLRQDLDWDYLDWFIERLGGRGLPWKPHIEAICWAAIAMRMGGGYLPPEHWYCWDHSHPKRWMLKAGVPPLKLLSRVPLHKVKMFHAGGVAKDWLVEAEAQGIFDTGQVIEHTLPSPPFEEFTEMRFKMLQAMKDTARMVGYT